MRTTIKLFSMLLLLPACDSGGSMTASDGGSDASANVDGGGPSDGAVLSDAGCLPNHTRCAWLYATEPGALDAFIAATQSNPPALNAVHPVWYEVLGNAPCDNDYHCGLLDGGCNANLGVCTGCQVGLDICAIPTQLPYRAGIMDAGIPVIPMVQGIHAHDLFSVNGGILQNPSRIQEHADKLQGIAKREQYAGLDLDYEGFQGGDEPLVTQIMQKFAYAMHHVPLNSNDGGAATVRLQANGDPGFIYDPFAQQFSQNPGGWNYAAITRESIAGNDDALDTLHVQLYDTHRPNTHAGPNSPHGLISRFVDFVTSGAAGVSSKNMCKITVGLANYCYEWSDIPDAGADIHGLRNCKDRCAQSTITVSTHQDGNCTYYPNRTLDFDGGTDKICFGGVDGGPHNPIYFDDGASLCDKIDLVAPAAARRRLGGVAYWQLGFEPPELWQCLPHIL